MKLYDHIVAETAKDLELHVIGNPLMQALHNGTIERGHYLAYLRETYHLVRHTSRALALAGARLEDERRGLRDWFFEQVNEENGHDLFCIKDVKHLGEDPSRVFQGMPMSGAWGLITQNYYMATYGNPVGILGVATATEGLGATMASTLADILVKAFGVPTNAVTFLRSHGGFDLKHLEDAKRAINEFVQEDEVDYVIHGRRMTFLNYGRLFCDAYGNPVPTSSMATAKKSA
jgi:pyrroloquinoline quinone (PQQ) biosynthesis protein C